MLVTVPPFRRYLGNEQIPKIPMTYPGTYAAGLDQKKRKTRWRFGVQMETGKTGERTGWDKKEYKLTSSSTKGCTTKADRVR
jgi:hypothetical protein